MMDPVLSLTVVLAAISCLAVAYGIAKGSEARAHLARAMTLEGMIKAMRSEHATTVRGRDEIIATERDRNEHYQRILDQYRSEGIQRTSFHDYGPPTPAEEVVTLGPKVMDWLKGVDGEDERAEFQQVIESRIRNGDKAEDILDELSNPAIP